MAIAVIGGLLVSTFLSLLFVPAFFAVMDGLGHLTWRVFGRFVEQSSPRDPGQTVDKRGTKPDHIAKKPVKREKIKQIKEN